MLTYSGIAELHNYQFTESEGGGSIPGDGEVGTGISGLGSRGVGWSGLGWGRVRVLGQACCVCW